MSHDLPGLEHYALKSMDYGQLTGLSIACHAVSDSFLLMHVGVGCKNKATAHLLVHDWKEHANIREGWTEVGDRDLILGASERVGPYLRSWYKRLEPGVFVASSVTFLDLAGEDFSDRVEQAERDLPCPVLHVKAPGYHPDMFLGYAKLIEAICRRIDFTAPPTVQGEAAVLGYWFDRYEGDHQGNLKQVESLFKLAGMKLGPVLLSGGTYAEALQAGRSELIVKLPHARPIAKKLRRILRKREVMELDLPMGLAATSRFVRTLAERTGRAGPQLDAVLQRRERAVLKQVETMLDRWRSLPVAVFAETPLASGLLGMLLELGLKPVLVGLRGATLGGPDVLTETLARDGHVLDSDCTVLEDPSLQSIRAHLDRLLAEGQLAGVFGAATDINMLTTLSPERHIHDHVVGRVAPQGPFVVEIGFPCRDWHAMLPMPYFGYGGVVMMTQRIVDARRVWDAGRTLTFHL